VADTSLSTSLAPEAEGTPTPQSQTEDGGTPTPEEPSVETPAVEAQVETPAVETKAVEPEPKKPAQVPWFQKRIDELTREKHEARRAAAALEQQVKEHKEALEAIAKGEAPKAPGTAKPVEDLTVEQRAAALASQREFDKNCNDIYDKGKAQYADFDVALRSYQNLGGLTPQFIEAAIEAGNPHQILYELTQDMDEASRILGLSPTRQAVALAKLSAKLTATPKTSAAPAPIKPLTSSGSVVEKTPEQMTVKEWMAWREQELEKRQRA